MKVLVSILTRLTISGLALKRLVFPNIRDRASSFGGEFHINSSPKRGTQITLSLPRGSDA